MSALRIGDLADRTAHRRRPSAITRRSGYSDVPHDKLGISASTAAKTSSASRSSGDVGSSTSRSSKFACWSRCSTILRAPAWTHGISRPSTSPTYAPRCASSKRSSEAWSHSSRRATRLAPAVPARTASSSATSANTVAAGQAVGDLEPARVRSGRAARDRRLLRLLDVVAARPLSCYPTARRCEPRGFCGDAHTRRCSVRRACLRRVRRDLHCGITRVAVDGRRTTADRARSARSASRDCRRRRDCRRCCEAAVLSRSALGARAPRAEWAVRATPH